jgi:hypothetical protein
MLCNRRGNKGSPESGATMNQSREPNEPPTCKMCGDEYSLNDGCEPTRYCHPCAQELAEDMGQLILFMYVHHTIRGGPARVDAEAILKKAGLIG